MCCSPFSSCTNAAMTIYQTEGIRAFYRSYFTQLTMNVPFQASLVTTYMSLQRFLNPDNEYSPTLHFVSGALAGAVASTVTMPFDNCKTLLNTQESGVLKKIEVSEINGLGGAAKSIRSMVGLRGFFSGLTPRILYQAPSTAISWSVYELIKYIMKRTQPPSDDDKCETLNSLKEHKVDPGGRQELRDNRELHERKHHNEIEETSLLNYSGNDDYSVDSSVGHTISRVTDHTLLLPQYIKPISNSKYLSASSDNTN